MTHIAKTPYYAVIFTSLRADGDDGYTEMSDKMLQLASKQPGFLGAEFARSRSPIGLIWTRSNNGKPILNIVKRKNSEQKNGTPIIKPGSRKLSVTMVSKSR